MSSSVLVLGRLVQAEAREVGVDLLIWLQPQNGQQPPTTPTAALWAVLGILRSDGRKMGGACWQRAWVVPTALKTFMRSSEVSDETIELRIPAKQYFQPRARRGRGTGEKSEPDGFGFARARFEG